MTPSAPAGSGQFLPKAGDCAQLHKSYRKDQRLAQSLADVKGLVEELGLGDAELVGGLDIDLESHCVHKVVVQMPQA